MHFFNIEYNSTSAIYAVGMFYLRKSGWDVPPVLRLYTNFTCDSILGDDTLLVSAFHYVNREYTQNQIR